MECDGEKRNLELIAISWEDDYLIAYPFSDSLQNLRLSDTLEVESEAEILQQRDQFIPSKFMEPERPSFLRKSLAWDSAFFTSAGVLDPDELSFINKGFKKAEGHLLPGIQEDLRVRRSAESESTLNSDGFYLESLEGNLFEDIRASIHKLASKKIDVGSRNRVKPMSASKRHSTKLQGSERSTKEIAARPQILQPNILSRVNPVSARKTKRTSLGSYIQMGSNTAKTGSGQSKKSGLGNSCKKFVTTTTPPPKSSSLITKKYSTISCSSYDSSASASSSKYSSNSTRRKMDSKNTKLASSSSSIHLSLMSNHSSSTSPASSIDGWFSESLSSTTTATQIYNNQEPSLDTTSRGACLGNDVILASDFQSHSHDHSSASREIQETMLTSPCTQKTLRGTDPVSAGSIRNFRPSGLRMPSPKIGFFDEEKSMLSTVRGGVQFHFGVQSALPDNDGATNEKRLGELQPAKTLPESENTKFDSQQTGVQHPAPNLRPEYAARFQGLDNASPKVSGTLRTMRNCSGISSKAQTNLSPPVNGETCSKSWKVGAGEHGRGKIGLSSSLKAERRTTKGISRNKMGVERKGQKNDDGVQNEATDSFKKINEEANGHHLENTLHLLHENKKENLSNLDDQVNGLSKYFEVIDLSRDVVIELKGKPSYSYRENHTAPLSSFNGEQLLCDYQNSLNRLSKPCPLSLHTTMETIPSTRTPLAEKTCVWNRSGSFGVVNGINKRKIDGKCINLSPSRRH